MTMYFSPDFLEATVSCSISTSSHQFQQEHSSSPVLDYRFGRSSIWKPSPSTAFGPVPATRVAVAQAESVLCGFDHLRSLELKECHFLSDAASRYTAGRSGSNSQLRDGRQEGWGMKDWMGKTLELEGPTVLRDQLLFSVHMTDFGLHSWIWLGAWP